jgi:ClpP class serine protease
MDKTARIKSRYDEVLDEIKGDLQEAHTQKGKRQKLIAEIGQERDSKLIVYVSKLEYMLDYDDVHTFGAMLDSVGVTKNIDLLLQSGGGYGVVAEKIVEMVRRYCTGQFRVIVPNLAKSAATMIALAADRIVMGVTSELGPIDPQLTVIQGNVPVSVSAQSFVDARNRLEKQVADAVVNNQPYQAYIAQLSSMNMGFIDHCEKAMDFAKDFAIKALKNYMLNGKKDSDKTAEQIAENLCSASTYFTHGRTISAQAIRNNPPLNNLVVDELDLDSEQWKKIFQLYIRCELFLDMDNSASKRKGKVFESESFSMQAEFPV